MNRHTLETPGGSSLLFVGPPLKEGPKPALFYFALSSKDSLEKDPFNQPVQYLQGSAFRIFSMTLPGHENNLPPENALTLWAEKMKKGEAVLAPFIKQLKEAIDHLTPYFLEGQLSVAGLSRGAFIACHIAALCPQITHILGFAPLTKLEQTKEFRDSQIETWDLEHLTSVLCNRTVRFYIGNQDTRVGTQHAFDFIHKLATAAQQRRIRSSPIELIIGPSIGYQGHGTSPSVFQSGVDWLKEEVLK